MEEAEDIFVDEDGDDGNSRGNGGGSGSREGYGRGIKPMTIHNIYNKGEQMVRFQVKRQEYVKYTFTENINPTILAYQALGWWFPIVQSQNREVYDGLCDISWGQLFDMGEIEIEVYGVTRERLLEGGSTNYKTYDFETSQNLFLTTLDRGPDSIPIDHSSWATNGKIPFDGIRWNGTPFDPNQDYYTREEIPQRTKKKIVVHFTPLGHNYLWRPTKSAEMLQRTETTNNTVVAVKLIPGPQNNNPYGLQANTTTNNSELLLRQNNILWDGAMMWDRATYPVKMLHPPNINDETGIMKWIYEVRMSTRLHCRFMLKPDYQDNEVDDMLLRQRWQLQETQSNNPKNNTVCNIVANAYEVKIPE